MTIKRISSGLWRDVFSTDRSASASLSTLAMGAFGMGGPVAAGLMLGQTHVGLTVGLGAILLAGSPKGPTAAPKTTAAFSSLVFLPALFAAVVAAIIAGTAFGDLAIIALAAAAGLSSGYSRPIAGAAIRFIVYLVLSVGIVDGSSAHHGAGALVFGLGALWNAILRSILPGSREAADTGTGDTRSAPTEAQRRTHFRRSLRTLAGWQFPLRMALGLSAAIGLRRLWPDHHFYWILLTVALLTQHSIEHLPVKTVQRLMGTMGGVAVAGMILALLSSPLVLGIAAGLLATLVPLARTRSYLLYSIVVTPLILLVLDIGRPIAPGLLTDRLIATIAGGVIVIAFNIVFDHLNSLFKSKWVST